MFDADDPRSFKQLRITRQTSKEDLPQTLNADEVCTFLDISKPSFYALVDQDKIPHFRLNDGPRSAIKVDKDALLRFLARQSRGPSVDDTEGYDPYGVPANPYQIALDRKK